MFLAIAQSWFVGATVGQNSNVNIFGHDLPSGIMATTLAHISDVLKLRPFLCMIIPLLISQRNELSESRDIFCIVLNHPRISLASSLWMWKPWRNKTVVYRRYFWTLCVFCSWTFYWSTPVCLNTADHRRSTADHFLNTADQPWSAVFRKWSAIICVWSAVICGVQEVICNDLWLICGDLRCSGRPD